MDRLGTKLTLRLRQIFHVEALPLHTIQRPIDPLKTVLKMSVLRKAEMFRGIKELVQRCKRLSQLSANLI